MQIAMRNVRFFLRQDFLRSSVREFRATQFRAVRLALFFQGARVLTVRMTTTRIALVRSLGLLLLCLGLLASLRAEDVKSIHPTGYVTDLAGIIQPQSKTQLENMCTELEQKTGVQMAIVTVKSLDGNDIDDYGNRLFQALGVGQKKSQGGLLLLVAPNDRKYRVEVGYGLEPIINDARGGDAGRTMVPYFRRGDFSGGVVAAAAQLAKYIADAKGVTLTGLPQIRQAPARRDDSGNVWIWIILGIIFFIVLAGSSRGGGGGRPGIRGGGGGSDWMTAAVLGSLLGGGNRGGWGGGGGGWGGGGGGGGGFGGFGGGSSGGGGASGSW
jgi:uncharacterized protein